LSQPEEEDENKWVEEPKVQDLWNHITSLKTSNHQQYYYFDSYDVSFNFLI